MPNAQPISFERAAARNIAMAIGFTTGQSWGEEYRRQLSVSLNSSLAALGVMATAEDRDHKLKVTVPKDEPYGILVLMHAAVTGRLPARDEHPDGLLAKAHNDLVVARNNLKLFGWLRNTQEVFDFFASHAIDQTVPGDAGALTGSVWDHAVKAVTRNVDGRMNTVLKAHHELHQAYYRAVDADKRRRSGDYKRALKDFGKHLKATKTQEVFGSRLQLTENDVNRL